MDGVCISCNAPDVKLNEENKCAGCAGATNPAEAPAEEAPAPEAAPEAPAEAPAEEAPAEKAAPAEETPAA